MYGTFTNTFLCADLLTIFHGVQCKIYLRYRLLVLHSTSGNLEVVVMRVTVHLVESSQD